MSETPALELRGVTAGYGNTTVLRDVSIHVAAKSVVALLGPNGAGKTTTLRTASGLLPLAAGQVLLHGHDVTHMAAYARAKQALCMIPEGRGIFPSLTVLENFRLQAPRGRGSRDSVVENAVDLFPVLRKHLRRTAGTLSGGQQQMVALARTYVSGASVILLDEVSMGLSPAMVDQVFDALRRLAARGTALLLVEQYATRALGIADEVVLMNKGSVSLRAPASEMNEDRISEHYLGAGVIPAQGTGARPPLDPMKNQGQGDDVEN